jgi:hypothetical protein
MRIKVLLILLTLLFVKYTNGQASYFEHKSLKKGKEFSFPVFSNTSDSLTARNINQFLQLSELELLDGYQTNNLFEKVRVDKGGIYGGKFEISFDILTNNPKILSILFNESSCGMTCTYWVKYYNFNSGNGDQMQLKDLFTTEGFITFNKIILRKRSAKFKREIKKYPSGGGDFLFYVLDCYNDDNLQDFYFKDTSIVIDGENCLSKNDKSVDIDMTTKFNLSEFKNYLNDYGKTVFEIKTDNISKYRSYELPQLYEGTIDSSLKILLIMRHDTGNKIIGGYAYLKSGRLIYLEGELSDKKLNLTEKTGQNSDNGYIQAIFNGKQITGTWINKSKSKSLIFTATRRSPGTLQ